LRAGPITPNGAVAFAVILIGAAMSTAGLRGLAILAAVAFGFAALEIGLRTSGALIRSIILVFPLALFMAIVWIGIVGRSPAEIAAGGGGTRSAAAFHVAIVCARLFIIVFAIQSVIACFSSATPLGFIRDLSAPIVVKRLLVLTLSLIETFRHAIDRAHTALIAAGLFTRRASLRNLLNAWVLVQTVWLTGITIAIGRLRDKWPIENTPHLLDAALEQGRPRRFSGKDAVWLPIVAAATILAISAA
jgi:hypothetical protein